LLEEVPTELGKAQVGFSLEDSIELLLVMFGVESGKGPPATIRLSGKLALTISAIRKVFRSE